MSDGIKERIELGTIHKLLVALLTEQVTELEQRRNELVDETITALAKILDREPDLMRHGIEVKEDGSVYFIVYEDIKPGQNVEEKGTSGSDKSDCTN